MGRPTAVIQVLHMGYTPTHVRMDMDNGHWDDPFPLQAGGFPLPCYISESESEGSIPTGISA